jgi:hypothetical protein
MTLDVCKKKMIVILLIVIIIIITSNKLIDKIFKMGDDTCSYCISVGNNGQITGWTISHFVLFLILGIICPNNFTFILIAGISWEILECIMEYYNKVLINSDKKITSDEFWHYYYGKSHNPHGFYWSSCGGTGQVLDVIMDLLGYITGSYIASYYNS